MNARAASLAASMGPLALPGFASNFQSGMSQLPVGPQRIFDRNMNTFPLTANPFEDAVTGRGFGSRGPVFQAPDREPFMNNYFKALNDNGPIKHLPVSPLARSSIVKCIS